MCSQMFTVHVSMTVTKTDDEGWPQQGVKMHAKLLTRDNHASGLGGAHCEVSLGHYRTYPV